MLIKAKKILYGDRARKEYPFLEKEQDTLAIEVEHIDYCCPHMEDFSKRVSIEIGKDKKFWVRVDDDYPFSFDILFCPWCGEQVKIKIVKVVRLKKVEKEVTEKRTEYIEEEVS